MRTSPGASLAERRKKPAQASLDRPSIGADTVTLGFQDEATASSAEKLLEEKIRTEKTKTSNNRVHILIKDGERMLPELLRLFDSNSLDVQNITLSRPSLDDVFLKYTGRSLREDENA